MSANGSRVGRTGETIRTDARLLAAVQGGGATLHTAAGEFRHRRSERPPSPE